VSSRIVSCAKKLARFVIAWSAMLAGISVFAQTDHNPVVIQVQDQQVTLDEFNRQFEVAVRMLVNRQGIEYDSLDQQQRDRLRIQYLRQRATELVMLQLADRLAIEVDERQIDTAVTEFYHGDGDGEARQRLLQQGGFRDEDHLRVYSREQERIRLATERVRQQIVVSPGDVMTLHHDSKNRLATPEQNCVRHIVVDDESTVLQLKAKLQSGEDFIALAMAHSTDKSTAANGGDMGCIKREHMIAGSGFESLMFTAQQGAIAGPVRSEAGYHLLLVYERKSRRTPTLDEAYKDLEDEIRHERLPEALAGIINSSRVETFPDRLEITEPYRE